MSYDISLVNPIDAYASEIGHYPSRLARFWKEAMLGSGGIAPLDGMTGAQATPHLVAGLQHLLAHPEYADWSWPFEGEYEEAIEALVAIWARCRLQSDYQLRISF